MINGLKRAFAKNYVNFRGVSGKKHIVVIESDDWGSIRTRSKAVYDQYVQAGFPAKDHYFVKNDCLESNDDLELLFSVLAKHRDSLGNPAVITADAVVANPDFDQIIASDKAAYSYQLLADTYKTYPKHDRVMELWKKHGIGENMLYPQYHGREHINVRKWMAAINSKSPAEKLAFDNRSFLNLRVPGDNEKVKPYMAAFDYEDAAHQTEIEQITVEGLRHFEEIFGFRSVSFVASSSIVGQHMNKVLVENGVHYNQCGRYSMPDGNGGVKLVHKFWGEASDGITYWRRNVTFEPSRNPDQDWVNSCMAEIATAFRWGKPAVINSHRVNYSSGIFAENRDNSLRLLDGLLKAILKKWPDTEFMNSAQLATYITASMK